jgi:hypothetical protein
VVFLIERELPMPIQIILFCLFAIAVVLPAKAAVVSEQSLHLAQAATPPTVPSGSEQPSAAAQRMLARFPQPVRAGDLIGLPLIDENHRTIGYVRKVVRTARNKIELIVDYDGWFGWAAHQVAVPIEVVGIQGRELASLDMPRSEYAAASPWQQTNETVIPDDASVKVALSKL